MELPFSFSILHLSGFQFDTRFPDTTWSMYPNNIPTHRAISATKIYLFTVSNHHFLSVRFDTVPPDTLGCVYPRSICNIRLKNDSWWSGKQSVLETFLILVPILMISQICTRWGGIVSISVSLRFN
jgi:hypothetical protein